MKLINSEEIKICDSCLVCAHWWADEGDVKGACYRYPVTGDAPKSTPPAHRCGEFYRDPIKEVIEVSKTMTLLESQSKEANR